MEEQNKTKIPNGDIPLSFDRLNQILHDSGLLPSIDDDSLSNQVISENSIDTNPVIEEKAESFDVNDRPLFDVISSDNIDLVREKPENTETIIINDADGGKKTPDVDQNLIIEYESFLSKLNELQIDDVINKSKKAEEEGIAFKDFYNNLVDEYKNIID